MFYKKTVLKNFAIFAAKYLCWSLFLITVQAFRLQDRCFPVNFAKYLRTAILKNICQRLLLYLDLKNNGSNIFLSKGLVTHNDILKICRTNYD